MDGKAWLWLSTGRFLALGSASPSGYHSLSLISRLPWEIDELNSGWVGVMLIGKKASELDHLDRKSVV